MQEFLISPSGRKLAYHFTDGIGPVVVFLGGFKSDMQGSKATHLEAWASAQGRAYLRLDYSGHGNSGGYFEEGCIGDWADDARAVIDAVVQGPMVLVGSSMGGWISLLTIRALGARVVGLVTIAAAPDFTEDGFWAGFPQDMRDTLMSKGRVALPSEYGDDYVITKHLIQEGRDNLVLRSPLPLPCPARFLQGTLDKSVSTETALRLLQHADGDDLRLTLVKGKDHSFSDLECLAVIETAVTEVLSLTA